jgi:hypothetical protein
MKVLWTLSTCLDSRRNHVEVTPLHVGVGTAFHWKPTTLSRQLFASVLGNDASRLVLDGPRRLGIAAEHQAENGERQLSVVLRQLFGLLAEKSALESLIFFTQVCVFSFLYSSRSRRVFCSSSSRACDSANDAATRSLTASYECRIADHLSSGDGRRSSNFPMRRPRTAAQELCELSRIELDRHAPAWCRHFEHAAVRTLVEEAVAVMVEPQHFQTGRAATGEHEERARLWVFAELVLHELRESIEPLAHVDRLGADEDPNRRGNHAVSIVTTRLPERIRMFCGVTPIGSWPGSRPRAGQSGELEDPRGRERPRQRRRAQDPRVFLTCGSATGRPVASVARSSRRLHRCARSAAGTG